MRGLLGGIATGALVSALGLGTLSVVSPMPVQPAPDGAVGTAAEMPATPVEAAADADTPDTGEAGEGADSGEAETAAADPTPTQGASPVGAVTIDTPQAPDLPDETALVQDTGSTPLAPAAPDLATPDVTTPLADTDPAQQPDAMSLDGTLDAPDAPAGADVTLGVDAPVLPNPQSLPPQTPVNETDLVLSTDPAQPVATIEEPAPETVVQDTETIVPPADDVFVVDLGGDTPANETEEPAGNEPSEPAALLADQPANQEAALRVAEDATPRDTADDDMLASAAPEAAAPRVQLQGGQNTLLGDRDTGVTVRRPTEETAPESAAPPVSALTEFAAQMPDTGGAPLMSVVLIDDGSMSAASAALAGLPFPVTIAVDPADAGAAERMAAYRAEGFEVAVLARIPEGALPSDVEVTLGSVFASLPETIAVLDIGTGGLQQDADVTEQAMAILAASGRGFLTAAQGLNMASRAAEQAGVPAAVIYRDLDAEGQDARVIRRFVDQAAFQARRESGVVLVGRVRPDTISALILWGAANQNAQVALVPVSAVLTAQ